MRLYTGALNDFYREVKQNRIAKRLEEAFLNAFRYRPSPGEVDSWKGSLLTFCGCLEEAELSDNGIILEMQLPRTSCRLDAMLTGLGEEDQANAVVVELKQWQKCAPSDADEMVSTWVGGSHRDVLHPSVQAAQYRDYLADMNTAFYEGESPIDLSACAYLQNYRPSDEDPLNASKFESIVERVPFFGKGDVPRLAQYLNSRLRFGEGVPILDRIDSGEIRPSKKLLEHVAAVIEGEKRFVLLDEQKVVFERAICEARKGVTSSRKSILLVRGGPGTGKSVLAANLLGKLCKDGLDVHYATGSRAFTESMRSIVGKRAAAQFKYFNSYTELEEDSVNVLVCDEAHRIREKSVHARTKKHVRESLGPQVDELIRAAKVTVFFIDDQQAVRPDEVGSAELIREKATQFDADLREFELEAQFRCEGSDGFVNWIDNTLGIRQTANQVWNSESDNFDFRIFATVEDLDLAIREKSAEEFSARLVAGFCWKWSAPTVDGSLEDDVKVGYFERPWNARPEATKLRKGIPKAVHWAIKPEGINQVGCVYTAQGFEFDYVGVIWGRDLRFSPEDQTWIGDTTQSHDNVVKRSGKQFIELVKNTYRVLLSRGLKGCYVYCQDPETAKYLLSRTEGLQLERRNAPQLPAPQTLLRVAAEDARPFQDSLPLYDLSVAAGDFGEFQMPELDSVEWVRLPSGLKATADMFVARVVGESMNHVIPNGSWCVFRSNPAGSRDGRIVIAQLRDYADPEAGGSFTVKRYHSQTPTTRKPGRGAKSGASTRKIVTLHPESSVSSFKPIVVPADDEQVRIVAEFVRLL